MIEAAAYVSLTKHLQVKLVDNTMRCLDLWTTVSLEKYQVDFWSITQT